MTREEAAERLKAILEEATEDENAVCYVTSYDADAFEMAIKALEQTEPERKKGKWIRTIDPDVNAWTGGHRCSECGRDCVQMSMNYCANCGAPMEVDG